ncbi:hypothetical protein [Pseudomonas ogarae]
MQRCSGNPKAGAVMVKDGKIISVGDRCDGVHGKRVAINAAIANGNYLKGATIYTTLEPCVTVKSKKESCSAWL